MNRLRPSFGVIDFGNPAGWQMVFHNFTISANGAGAFLGLGFSGNFDEGEFFVADEEERSDDGCI